MKRQPKVKGSLPGFDLDTVNRRLSVLGPEPQYEIQLDDRIKFTSVPRRFLSETWGGNMQKTFPQIRQDMLDIHGLDDWMYPNLLWNPSAPEIPGFPGLFFWADGIDGPGAADEKIYRVIVRLKSGPSWQYIGQYKRIGAPSLTKEEWQLQTVQVSKYSLFV